LAKDRTTGGKKRRTRGHIIADLAVNHIERQVLFAGFTMQRIASDYGLDALIKTYDARGEVENGLVWLQIKATDHARRFRRRGSIALRVQRKDLIHWLGEIYPVILTLYDATVDQAFWLHVQEEFRRGKVFALPRTGASLTVQVPRRSVVNQQAVREFQRRKSQDQRHWEQEGETHA
jgi:hypothetical protein